MRKKWALLFTIALAFLFVTAAVHANTMTNFSGSWDFRFFYHLSSRMVNDLGNGSADGGIALGDEMVTATMADTSLLENTSSSEETVAVPNGTAPIEVIDTPPPAAVPEPSTSLLFATGIASLAVAWFGRKNQ